MNQSQDIHLTYDDLLRTLVDPDDLGVEVRAHLDSCPRCQNQARHLARRYTQMGQMAKSLAPAASGAFRLPEQRTFGPRWQFKSAMAVGLAGLLVFFFTVWWPRFFDAPGPTSPDVAQSIDADEQLMAQIDELVMDALPDGYQELAMINGTDITDLSEDLIDWIVPSIDETIEESEPIG